MEVWEIVLYALAIKIAVQNLIGLMTIHRNQILAKQQEEENAIALEKKREAMRKQASEIQAAEQVSGTGNKEQHVPSSENNVQVPVKGTQEQPHKKAA